MSLLDESRYGKACLLVLNICPFTLRHVIDDYYRRQGSLSLQDFLETNKHDLFHLYKKRCCCGFQQSGATPINKGQWDLLYIRNGSACTRGQRGDCPCQYDTKPGITTNVMDVTLCCLVITNICTGVTLSDIRAIREVRNELIHAESARLDEPSYRQHWNKVKTAVLNLAKNVTVPSTLCTDTSKKIQDLENQLMNSADLDELRKLIIDQKRFTELETDVINITEEVSSIDENLSEFTRHLTQTIDKTKRITKKVAQNRVNINKTAKKIDKGQDDISRLEKTVVDQRREYRKMQQEELRPIQQELSEHRRLFDKHGRQIDGQSRRMQKQKTWFQREITKTNRRILSSRADLRRETREMQEMQDEKLRPIQQELLEHGRQFDEQSRRILMQKTKFNREFAEIKNKLTSSQDPGLAEDVLKLKQRLIAINDRTTKVITLSPLQERGEELPIELLYAQVVIHEDAKYIQNRQSTSKHNIEVTVPGDIFMKDGQMVQKIYMLGDAAHGKTTYCIWLIKNWCNAQRKGKNGNENLDKWEIALKKFDFVFLLQFRYVNPKRASVLDMICHDIFKNDKGCQVAINHVLSTEKYRSLIIMDGLDEWNPNEAARDELTDDGIPNIEDLSSTVSSIISMRPWMFPKISKIEINDRVLEIQGLSRGGIERVIKNVLLNHYHLEDDSPKYSQIINHLDEKGFIRSFMQIPLLAVICVQIWYEGKQVGNSMTSFYAVMLNMLIERANQKHKLAVNPESVQCELSNILSENECIEKYMSLLLKLGKVAYEGLLSNDTNLVFQKRKLEKQVGAQELQFALDVGLISQKEARSLLTKNVSVHFFHKSIQEFLAAFHISTHKETRATFCEQLSSLVVIMELSNVITFICGMCPSLGSLISQTVVRVTDRHTSILNYRESSILNETVVQLYKLQLRWFKEFQYSQTDGQLIFHVSDVIFSSDYRSMEEISLSRTLLEDHYGVIKSLCLSEETEDQLSISDSNLNEFILNTVNTESLLYLYIKANEKKKRSVVNVRSGALRKIYLKNISIQGTEDGTCVCPPLLANMSNLRLICLENISFEDKGIEILPDMVHLETLILWNVKMAEEMWERFVSSLDILQQSYDIIMRSTNTHDKALAEIRRSPNFSILQDRYYGWVHITRLWPLKKIISTFSRYDDTYEILYSRVPLFQM